MFAQAAAAAGTAFANIWNANKQAKLQKQFAQHGLSWKVADAKRAGIHPLAALGAQTTQYSPQSLGLGDSLTSAGQSVDNALHRSTDQHTRTMATLAEERAMLENTHLKQQIISSRVNRTGMPPALRTNSTDPPGPAHTGLRDSWISTVPGVLLHDPRNSPAQAYQDSYGDLLENVYGVRNWARDQQYTLTGIPGPDSWALLNHRLRYGRDNGRHYRHR